MTDTALTEACLRLDSQRMQIAELTQSCRAAEADIIRELRRLRPHVFDFMPGARRAVLSRAQTGVVDVQEFMTRCRARNVGACQMENALRVSGAAARKLLGTETVLRMTAFKPGRWQVRMVSAARK